MKCDRCGGPIEEGEERELYGRELCEDCYMDSISPSRMCDPWAEYSAKSFSEEGGSDSEVTETQAKILEILKESGGADPIALFEGLQKEGISIKPSDLEREIAALRHMKKLRGERREGKIFFRLW